MIRFWRQIGSLRERTSEGPLRLLILAGESPRTEVLPARGTVCVGRSEEADVQLDEPDVSRRHFTLHIDSSIELEDLGTANGTVVRGRKVPSRERVQLGPGDTIEIGQAVLVLRTSTVPLLGRTPLHSHEHLQGRLDAECRLGGERAFPLLRIRTRPGQGQELLFRLVEVLTTSDLVAEFGPNDYEVLVLGSELDPVVCLRDVLTVTGVAFGAAWYPRDGRSAVELLGRASTRLELSTQPRRGRIAAATTSQRGVGSNRPASGFPEQLEAVLDRIAPTPLNVLLLGEAGVGKGFVAEEIHRRSNRSEGPFIPLQCGDFPESRLEAELFGYEIGRCFTGSTRVKTGLVEAADGGTLFLDEVAEIPSAVQVRLLRILESGEFRRLGSAKVRKTDVRLVSASSVDLERACARGEFRPDLYFRLNGLTLSIPPLRERKGEIEPLAHRFIEEFSASLGVAPPALAPEALEALQDNPWIGNIRELRYVMERAVALCAEGVITRRHLRSRGAKLIPRSASPQEPSCPPPLMDERSRIAAALESCGGNHRKAALLLRMSRETLIARLEQYGLPQPVGRRS